MKNIIRRIYIFLMEEDNCGFLALALCILFLVLISLFASCCPCRKINSFQKDSIRIETHFIATEKIDTQYIELPMEIYRNAVKDTFSCISTNFASSTAKISDGILYHEIRNKKTKIPVEYVTRTEYKDSILYRDRNIENIVVENKLTGFQKFQIYGFWCCIVLMIVSSTIIILKKKIK